MEQNSPDKPYRNIVLAPNRRFVSRRALRACICANRQPYQNVSRETFWYDWRAKSYIGSGLQGAPADGELGGFPPSECFNYFRNAGNGST
ncbi:MAG: hypothetical protein M3Z96_06640 [Pseudomonadota bacterium]|nr:hypothetical protein [Pseudomonadota bacterium]